MILLIDIGNTRTKYTLVKNKNSRFNNIVAVENEAFDTDYIIKLCSVDNKVSQIVVACVANQAIIDVVIDCCTELDISFTQVKSEIATNLVTSGYDKPEQLGVDRWLGIIAGQKLFPQKNVLIIDAGTATTIDLLDSMGKHLGGWIFAGISLLFTSLLGNTEDVCADIKDEASLSFGFNTSDNVNNACWAATIGLITQAIVQAKIAIDELDKIIITGGNGKILHSITDIETVFVEDLLFYGLREYTS